MMPQDSEERQDGTAEPQEAEIKEPADLEQVLAEANKKAGDYLASWQRTQADFINYKRRTEQERQEFASYANASLMLSLLPVLDDLDRTLDAAPPAKAAKHGWLEGVKLVDRKLRSILEAQGLKPVAALGEPFDPNFHEALRQASGRDGIVIEELQKGYMIKDKLLRPARVVVGNGEAEAKGG